MIKVLTLIHCGLCIFLGGWGEKVRLSFIYFKFKGDGCKSGKLAVCVLEVVMLEPAASCLTPGCSPSWQTIESNWRCGRHNLQRIQCRSENSKGVYCLQYDDEKIISGLRDNSIKVNTFF